ncbi:CBS domain-containing protein [Paenibacillaceae bacterium]|nr:CBS domain-containing protein [Paenibacillaceae bacterium]
MKTVEELMTADCVTASMNDNVYELAVLMKEHDIGMVPIVDGKKLVGVVTDRDLVIRGYAEKQPGSCAVSEVITTDAQTIEPETSVHEAARIMADHQIRRLPVTRDGELVGVVAIGDLAITNIFADEAGEALSRISEDEQSTFH